MVNKIRWRYKRYTMKQGEGEREKLWKGGPKGKGVISPYPFPKNGRIQKTSVFYLKKDQLAKFQEFPLKIGNFGKI